MKIAHLVRVLLLFTFCTFYFSSFSQKTISGIVTSLKTSLPVSGASVTVKGSVVGTATDSSGKFSVKLPEGKTTLVIASIGYEEQEFTPTAAFIAVQLKEKVSALNEIVITGYSAQRKKDLTGAITVVNVEDLTSQPTAQISDQLQGRAAGVTILSSGQPGSTPQVRIRGINTFGNNSPLYVIDGVPTQNISDINPNDISSMQVLKDAASASIYGSRASNGVIILTTKRGKGKLKVQYDGYLGNQVPKKGNVWNMLSSQGMADLKWLAYNNSRATDTISDPLYGIYFKGSKPTLPDYINPPGAKEGDPSVDPSKYYVNPDYTSQDDLNSFYRITKANKTGTDWFHEIFKPAMITSHNVSLSGSSNQASYFFSFNYFNQQGTLLNQYMKRYTLRSNTVFNVTKQIRVGENLEYSIIDNPTIGALTEGSAIGMAFREQPIVPAYDIMGNFAGSSGSGLGNADNPVAIQKRKANDKGLANRFFGNVYAEADLASYLTFRTSFGGEMFSASSQSFSYPEYESAENSTTNSYKDTTGAGFNWTWTNTITFHKTFSGAHDVKLLAGYEAFNNKFHLAGGTTYDYFTFDPNYTTLSTGTGTQTNYSRNYTDALTSIIGRLDYSFKGKYLFGATIRRDGSSKFIKNRNGTFPAFSAGWRLSDENFMKNISWISDLKIRGGWGIMGNQLNVTPSNSFTTFGPDKPSAFYDINGTGNTLVAGFRQVQYGNPIAKWESDVNTNIGFDATILHGLLQVSADYYQKDIRDLLYNPAFPGTAGYATAYFDNVAKMKNTGFDLSVNLNKDISRDFNIDATATLTTYKNKIIAISDGVNYFDQEARRFNGSYIIRNAIGHPVSSYYGYQVEGFFNSVAEVATANEGAQKVTGDPAAIYQSGIGLGRFRYRDINKDGRITADDRTFLGNPNPKFSYGLNIVAKYKAFDCSIFLYGVSGNDIWNQIKWWTDFYPSFAGAKSNTALYDSWTPTHHNAKAPIQELEGNFSTNNVPNSYYVEKGSYLRAKNVQLGYTFPADQFKKAGISKFRVYVQAANLFTITKYSGIDPEIGGSSTSFGIDEGAYPSERQYLIGLNLTFL